MYCAYACCSPAEKEDQDLEMVVEPSAGRAIIFSSSPENPHLVERVTSGNADFLILINYTAQFKYIYIIIYLYLFVRIRKGMSLLLLTTTTTTTDIVTITTTTITIDTITSFTITTTTTN